MADKKEELYHHIVGGRKFLELALSVMKTEGQRRPIGIILDAGCGSGNLCRAMAEAGYQAVGVDISACAIEEAKKLAAGLSAEFVQADITAWNETRRFDAVTFTYALEHIPDPVQALAQIKRLTKPQGVVLIAIPNGHGPYEIFSLIPKKLGLARRLRPFFINDPLVRKMLAGFSSNFEDNPHLHYFSLNKAVELFLRTGFEVERYYKVGSFLLALHLPVVNRILQRRRAFEFFDRLDGVFSKLLPARLAAGWLFVLRPGKK
ncbi:class I SAM-dependent methyltransferase [candidate division TA06 bacterium]|uniref:Class I SAM-dependent methyltransferase n=1 Tax=candidate division TA06 bacterium TaxID=2250710 RepID=A0A933IAC5_UNCT6|nr:class I SAM-dependent methyltransferase [candidate division TA06 bacterium]